MFKTRRLLLDPAPVEGGGGNAITPEALKAAIEKARLEERTHLRQELDAAKTQAANAEAQVTALNTQLTEAKAQVTTLTTELTTLRSSVKVDGAVDVEALVTRTAAATQANIAPRITELETQLANERTLRETLAFNAKRDAAVRQAATANNVSAELLSELVKNTKEGDLESTITAQVNLLKTAIPANTAPGNAPAAMAPGSTSLPPPGGSAPGAAKPTESVRQIPDADWRTQRKQRLQDAAKRYVTGSPLVTG